MPHNPEVYKAWYEKNREKKILYAQAYYRANRDKKVEQQKNRRKANPRGWVEEHRKRLYGIDNATFDRMLEKQGGKCAICEKVLDSTSKPSTPHIDHDHATGRVRGILCGKCNISIGHIEKNGFIEKALKYLGV